MLNGIGLLEKSLDSAMLRYNTLSNNIANVDTVGYKRKDVRFEETLQVEMSKNGANVDELSKVNPEVYVDNSNLSYRADGNNVDIDVEAAELVKTKLKYDTLISRATATLSRYKYVLQNMK